jgi:hypothetical protein
LKELSLSRSADPRALCPALRCRGNIPGFGHVKVGHCYDLLPLLSAAPRRLDDDVQQRDRDPLAPKPSGSPGSEGRTWTGVSP